MPEHLTPRAILELRVRNHPGALSHIAGLFARRAFNLESIVCLPAEDGVESVMYLQVAEEPRLQQVERQLARLEDVLSIAHRPDLDAQAFRSIGASMRAAVGVR